MNSLKKLVIGGAALSLSACASVVSDNNSTNYIETNPESASCDLHGQDFKRVVKTPNSIHLPSSAAPIVISCKADGHFTTTYDMDTEMDGWILGNIILGGGIGFVVDAVRGAGQKFPPKVTFILEPSSFKTEASRDKWFADRLTAIEQKYKKIIESIEIDCANDTSNQTCPDQLKQAKDKENKEIERLQANKTRAAIVGI